MRSLNQRRDVRRSAKARLAAASMVLEPMESRLLMSTTVAAWNFDSLTVSTTPSLSPAPSTGTGTALTVGLQTSSSNINSPGGVYANPNPNASGTGDISDILNGTGNNPSGNQADHSSSGATSGSNATGTNPAWRIRGSSDGWSSNAAKASQGAQFMASTAGASGISLTFDFDASSASALSEIAVQYTTNGGSTWTEAPSLSGGTDSSNGNTDGISVATNSTNSNIVSGQYFQIANNADGLFWQNGLTADFSGINAVNNNASFGVRIVNAATGAAEIEVGGAAFPAAGAGNWRLDNIQINATGGTLTPPTITTNPTNQTVAAGQPVTFTAAASGAPTPTVQWFEGTPGSGSIVGGATSNTLSFTTSSTAADNGNTYYAEFTNSQGVKDTTAATLTDTLAVPVVTTQPTSVSTTIGSLVTFTAAASGSPLPTVQWQSSPNGSVWSNISGAISTTYSFTAASGQNGEEFRALFTNSQAPSGVASNAATLTLGGTVLAAWNFDGLTAAVNHTPTPSSGSGTASSVGMTTDQTGNSGPFPIMENAAEGNIPEGPDLSAIESDPGSSDPATVNPENWKVVGTKTTGNGWNYLAPIGSQGAQFMVSTVGFQSVQLSFDWGVSGFTANGQLAVEYTTNGGTAWLPAPSIALGANTNSGAGSGDTAILTNSSNSNIIVGPYFQDQSNTHGGSNDWQNGLSANFIGVAGVDNNPNFGIRLVNAATGAAAVLSAAGTGLPSQTSANWRFDDVLISGNNPVAPIITTNPSNQSVAGGATATFTAAASAYPAATVQWYSEAVGATSFTPDTTDSGNTTTTLHVVASLANAGTQYEAIFTNTVGSTPTTPATLFLGPAVTTQPVSQTVAAGATNVTFTAAATGTPTPSVQWEVEAPGASSFTPVSGANFSGATSTTLTILAATESLTGDKFEAVFTNTAGVATTNPATLTVTGTPIAQWIFTGGEAPPAGGSTGQGTGNSPDPTFGPLSNTANTNGLVNDYTGIQAFSESDILIERSTLNASFSEYDWRVRSGNGLGPTGSPGTPEGWSQNAPEWDQTSPVSAEANDFEQGVQFGVNTTGYNDITLHLDWNQGGISDMQPVYSLDGGSTWTALPNSLIEQTAPSGDFYGITATTVPTGITVNLQGIAGASNNPNFELQLDAEYSPTLPLISDGNELDPTVHGQYATGIAGNVNAQQVIQFGNDLNSTDDVTGGNFTLTYTPASGPAETTGNIAFSSSPTTLAANITTALDALAGLNGNFTVAQTNPAGLNPERDGLGVVASDMTVTFNGALAHTAVATLTAANVSLTGSDSNPASITVQNYVNGSAHGFSPYVDGGGAWQVGNISFNGDSVQAGGLAITANPSSVTGTTGFPVIFTASAYSEISGVTAQWFDNGVAIGGATNISGSGPTYSSTYTFDPLAVQNGDLFTCKFTQTSANVTSQPATLTVVAPSAPVVVVPPFATSAQAGEPAVFSSTATGSPAPTIQWQISSDNGSHWTNLTDSATVIGSTSTTLDYTTNINASENGDLFRAVFTNAVTSINSPAVVLTVLSPETVLDDWDFNNGFYTSTYPTGFVNNPAPVPAGVDGSVGVAVGATAAQNVGITLPFNPADPATGIAAPGSVDADDLTNTAGSLNSSFNENTWRIRGGPTAITGGTPANGWSNLVGQYSQGVQFSVPTTGYANVYVTMDWYATTSGELDAQPQYTLDGTNWLNLGNEVQAVSADFYGATASGGPIPLVFNVSNIAGAANNSNFGIRLVNAYDPTLSNTQDLELGDTSNFTLTFNGHTTGTIVFSATPSVMAANVQAALAVLTGVGASNVTVTAPSGQSSNLQITWVGLLNLAAQPPVSSSDINDDVITNYEYANALLVGNPATPAPYNGSKGNWRFDNIVFHGDPTWLNPTSSASWNEATQTLTVTGAATIIGDPSTMPIGSAAVASNDFPSIIDGTSGSVLTIAPTTTPTNIHLGGITLSNGAEMNVKPLGSGHHALIVGTAANGPTSFTIDATSSLNLENNDLIVHNGGLTTVSGLVASGANDGTWNGDGIFSSNAAASHNSELGVEMNTTGATSIDGEGVTSSDVVVLYTFDGAVNFSTRSVTANDYIAIDNGFNLHLSGFVNGDFNYDGVINGDDYAMIDNAYNSQLVSPLAVAAGPLATNSAQIAKAAEKRAALPGVFSQTVVTASDDSDMKKRRGNVWADLGI